MDSRRKIVLCYPSLYKENEGIDILYGPLSLAYIARHTPDHYEITLYDEYVGDNLNPHTVEAEIVAFSAISSGINRAYNLAHALRKRNIICVLGGAHGSAMPDEAKQHFDVVIKGEGEEPWRQFLRDYEDGDIKSMYYGRMDVSLKSLGTPDRKFIHPNYPYPSLMTSRGCPFKCSFCYLNVYTDRKYRTIPHDTVLEDMESLRGEKIVIITDENFIGYKVSDYENRKQLLSRMIEQKFEFYWGCQTSVNIAFQSELLELMYNAGCRVVFIGYETNNEESLVAVNKKQNLNLNYKQAIKNIHRKKIAVIASTILGLDDQESGYHKLLIQELKRIKVDLVRVFFLTAWPGTIFYNEMMVENRISKEWDLLRKDIPTLKFRHYSNNEIIQAREEIMKAFYNKTHVVLIIIRWIFKDSSLIRLFIKIWLRSIVSERIRVRRAYDSINASS